VAALVEQLRHGDGSRVAAARTAVLASRHAERLRRGGDAAADLLLATADPRMAPAMVVERAGPTGVVLLPADRR
jgi:hypothetical protein